MTEAVQIALIVAAGPTLVALGSVYVAIRADRRQAQAQKDAAVKVEEVKTTLTRSGFNTKTKLNELQNVADKTHDLVNGAMSAQMSITAVALRSLATVTNKADDIKAAELAEKALSDHEERQRTAEV